MSATAIAWLTSGAIQWRNDELCPKCLTTAGYKVEVLLLTEDGITPQGHVSGCARCDLEGQR